MTQRQGEIYAITNKINPEVSLLEAIEYVKNILQ